LCVCYVREYVVLSLVCVVCVPGVYAGYVYYRLYQDVGVT